MLPDLPRCSFVCLAALGCAACGDDARPEADRSQPGDFVAELPLVTPEDEDPDPNTLEITLRARVETLEIEEGRTTNAWTYGGTVPGPLLRLTAGDRLIVHFENDLPEATTIHWHGVRVPAEMDGSPHSQAPVEPGETFTYDFVVPDPGLFWYHPHLHDAAQLGFGLYGALLVDPAEPTPTDLGDEVVLVLSDMAIGDDGSLGDPDGGGDIATLFGREGETLLVNGKVQPTLHARNGQRQRWRIVNAAKSRYFLLGLTGHSFTRIGSHTGWLAEPETHAELLLTPGERADVLVTPLGDAGATEQLLWLPFDRGYGSTEFRPPRPILDVEMVGAPLEALSLPDLSAAPVPPIDASRADQVEIRLTSANDEEGELYMGINGVPFEDAEPIAAFVGETQLWKLDNEMEWDHPFHLHGFFFQRTNEHGVPLEPIEWLDTVNVPRLEQSYFAVRYDNRPGSWMFHCHILDHSDAGMMGMIDLQP